MERPSLSFFVMLFILLISVIAFILVVFELRRVAFLFELALLLSLMFVLAFGMFLVYHNKRGSWNIIAIVLVIMLIDVFAISLLTRRFSAASAITLLFSIAGIGVAAFNILTRPKLKKSEEADKYYYSFIDKMEPKETNQDVKEAKATVVKAFTPGKYVASKKANKFHSPKCDWAQKINKENQLWFNSEAEAKSKGFEADKCIG